MDAEGHQFRSAGKSHWAFHGSILTKCKIIPTEIKEIQLLTRIKINMKIKIISLNSGFLQYRILNVQCKIKKLLYMQRNRKMGPTVKRKTDNKNCPLDNPDIDWI